jgi:hypothetical protein
MCFADGHAELHKWRDPRIVAAGLKAASGVSASYFSGPTRTDDPAGDYRFIAERYLFPANP